MKVAVVGSGIAGLGAGYVLARRHRVVVFEQDARAGGHSNTVEHAGLGLDTGFLVHNERNYPLLTRLFGELGVRTHESDMSFSVSCEGCGLEYAGRRPFAQRANLARPAFHSLLREIARWLRTARRSLDERDYERVSLEEYLSARGYSQRFRRHFLVPLTSALWSTPAGRALEFPAAYAIRFFENHGMLGFGRFRWRTVSGGSRTYVDALRDRLDVRLGSPVRGVRRDDAGVDVRSAAGDVERFDAVVVATHADQALRLLEDASPLECETLGAFGYQRNETVLHTDATILPRARTARASWNYRLNGDGPPTVTYWLNALQKLDADRDYLVSLNQHVADEHVLARFTYEHPQFTVATLDAQRALPSLNSGRTAFAGAYHGNGFHEDGLASGVRAAEALGASW